MGIETFPDELLVTRENAVAWLTINRPQSRNSLTPAYLRYFASVVQELEADSAVRVIALTGAGKAFSSGGDMQFLNDVSEMTTERIREVVYGGFQGATRALKLCRKPTVAVVNGPAVGAGCELAVACDFRLAAQEAFFCENWIDLGLIAPLGGMFLLPRLIGAERAADMLMRATKVSGDEAKAIGLASLSVPQEQLIETARQFCNDLASRPPTAISILKQGLRRGAESTLASEWEFNVMAQSGLLKSAEFAQAVAALREKIKGGR